MGYNRVKATNFKVQASKTTSCEIHIHITIHFSLDFPSGLEDEDEDVDDDGFLPVLLATCK